MPDTFETAWRTARNHFPSAPALLVRDWVQDAYTRLCGRWDWAWLRREGFLATADARSVTVTAVQGSATVTSVGAFLPADAGRQFRGRVSVPALTATYPIYTIDTVVDANTITLDQPYAAENGVFTATILTAYAVLPADFDHFLMVIDPYTQRPIPWWLSQDQIARADPARASSDSGPRALIAQAPSRRTATLGQIRYEYWPLPTAARQYPYLYVQRPQRLADDTALPPLLAERSDLLKLGAQLQAAEWPGTTDLPNPYYDLRLAQRLGDRWEREIQQLTLKDDAVYPQQVQQIHWDQLLPNLPMTTRWLRTTDATLVDYL